MSSRSVTLWSGHQGPICSNDLTKITVTSAGSVCCMCYPVTVRRRIVVDQLMHSLSGCRERNRSWRRPRTTSTSPPVSAPPRARTSRIWTPWPLTGLCLICSCICELNLCFYLLICWLMRSRVYKCYNLPENRICFLMYISFTFAVWKG